MSGDWGSRKYWQGEGDWRLGRGAGLALRVGGVDSHYCALLPVAALHHCGSGLAFDLGSACLHPCPPSLPRPHCNPASNPCTPTQVSTPTPPHCSKTRGCGATLPR
jgi:hypothetical protein